MEPEPQPETASALVCGTALSTTATELNLTGVRADDRAAFSALPELVNLRTLILSNSRFSDEGWAELMTALRKCPHLTRLEMVGCCLGPKHAGDLADFLSDATQFTGSLKVIALDEQRISGTTSKYGDGNYRYIGTLDADLSGFKALCEALSSSQMETITRLLHERLPAPVSPVVVDVSGN